MRKSLGYGSGDMQGLFCVATDEIDDLAATVEIWFSVDTGKLYHVMLGSTDLYWVLNSSVMHDIRAIASECHDLFNVRVGDMA